MKNFSSWTCVLFTLLALHGCGGERATSLSEPATEKFMSAPVERLTISFPGPRKNYQITRTINGIQVTDLINGSHPIDVTNATDLQFNDVSVNLRLARLVPTISTGQLQNLIELYIAFFNRLPDADGMAYWIEQLSSGRTLEQIAENFYSAGVHFPELTGYSSSMSDSDFVRIIYKNVLGRSGATAPSEPEVLYWATELSSGRQSKSALVTSMLNSARTFVGDANFGWVPQLLDNKLAIGRYTSIEQGVSYLNSTDNITRFGALASRITATDTSQALDDFGIRDLGFSLTAKAPGEPQQLRAYSANSSGGIFFIPPQNSGGLPILNYRLDCQTDTGSVSSQSENSPIAIQGLSNGKSYTCRLFAINAYSTSIASQQVTITPVPELPLGNFGGNIVLGSPTDNSIKANIFSATQNGRVSIRFGTSPGIYDKQTEQQALIANVPLEITLTGLRPDTRYYYRLDFESQDRLGSGPTVEYSFQSARSPGQSFTFALQGDSHPEREKSQFDGSLYTRTLQTAATDKPDFYLLMGDDFSVDTLDPKTINAAKVRERYTIQRPYLGIIGSSSPVFLVNGNHEQAAKFNLNGTPENIAVWAQNARNTLYSQPAPDNFYTGNKELVPFIGLLRNYYAWTWGDALFVVIDPYWASSVAVDNVFGGEPKRTNMWDVTHGDEQYLWLKETLEKSKSKYKFVFAHHVMGTGRGGIELAGLWEWGGKNSKGISEFSTQRPRWDLPIHQLMVANKVSIFFQGHDHIWVHQQLDGVTYQSLSEPADPNYALWNSDAYLTGERFPNTGYTRVKVAPTGVRVEYIRTYLPKDEGPGKVSGSPVFGYTIP